MKQIFEKMYQTGLYLCIWILITDYVERTDFGLAFVFMALYIFGMLWMDAK